MLSIIGIALPAFQMLKNATKIASAINWKIALPIIAAVGMMGFSYYKGFSDAASRCKSEELAAELREVKAEINKSNVAKADAEKRASTLETDNNALANKVNDYVTELSKHIGKNGACKLDGFDLRKLRNF